MKDVLIFLVPFGVLARMKLWTISWYVLGFLVCWKESNYERFLDMSGAFWCVEKRKILNDFLIFLVPFGVLEKLELWSASWYFWCLLVCWKKYERCPAISGAFWCVGKDEIMNDFLICIGLSGVLKKIELWTISWYCWCWCTEKGLIINDFLIFLVSSGVLKIVELYKISGACWCVEKDRIINDFLLFWGLLVCWKG